MPLQTFHQIKLQLHNIDQIQMSLSTAKLTEMKQRYNLTEHKRDKDTESQRTNQIKTQPHSAQMQPRCHRAASVDELQMLLRSFA